MSQTTTSLIIASRDRQDLLYDTVKSVLEGDDLPNEIIVIDQSHGPHPALSNMGFYRGCDIRYCLSGSVGVSLARNTAMRMARYETLAIIDDDVIVQKGWLSALIAGMLEGGPKCAVSGKVLDTKSSEDGFAPSTMTDDEPALYQGRVGRDVLWSNNMAMPKRVIGDVGYFDERLGPGTMFPAAEDNDYGFRLLEAGYRIAYLPSAAVYHRDWRPRKDYLNLRWKYGVGRGAFYAKYFSLVDRYSLNRMVRDISNHLLSVPSGIRHDRLKVYGDFALVVGMIAGAGKWLMRYGRSSNAVGSQGK